MARRKRNSTTKSISIRGPKHAAFKKRCKELGIKMNSKAEALIKKKLDELGA